MMKLPMVCHLYYWPIFLFLFKNKNSILVSLDIISLGCLQSNDHIHQYVIPERFDEWKLCRDECYNRKTKVSYFRCGTNLPTAECIGICFSCLLPGLTLTDFTICTISNAPVWDCPAPGYTGQHRGPSSEPLYSRQRENVNQEWCWSYWRVSESQYLYWQSLYGCPMENLRGIQGIGY